MLSARFLAQLSDDLVELYSQMEFEIKADIFKRLNKLQKVTDATIHQAEILKQTGALKSDINKIVEKYNEKARPMLIKLYEDAMQKSREWDLKFYPIARRKLSENQTQIMNASIDRFYNADVINKTYDANSRYFDRIAESITRMTLTVADTTQRKFIQECNRAYMKVSSGAYDWKSAYKSAVINLSRDAVKCGYTYRSDIEGDTPTIKYSYSGTIREYSIESATKMNILTGINQTASEQTLENAEDLGTTLVEVSAHIGARPEHEEWQGRIFSLKDGGEYYIDENGAEAFAPDFKKECKLGEPDGICGINCRHSFYPYFAGFEIKSGDKIELVKGQKTEYSNNELDEYKEERVIYNGSKITPYEAEQNLRICERAIRTYKAEVFGLELTDNTQDSAYTRARNTLWNWQEKARDITEQTGIQRKYINEYIGTPTGAQPRGLKPKDNN